MEFKMMKAESDVDSVMDLTKEERRMRKKEVRETDRGSQSPKS